MPALFVIVTRAGHAYLPVQDLAYIDLRVRDVWSRDIPLIGAYSRSFSHPGPLFFWLLAIPSGIFGRPAWATLVGAAALQATAIAWSARLAWERGRLLLVALVLLATMLAFPGPWTFVHAWNPGVALPFFGVYLLLVWSLSLGEPNKLVWAVVVGVFLVQTHIGYALLVAIPAVWAGVLIWDDTRSRGSPRAVWKRPIVVSLVVAIALWIPAFVEQITHPPGNLRRIYWYFRNTAGDTVGFRKGAGFWATEYKWLPPWLGGHESFESFSVAVEPSTVLWLVVPAALVAVGVYMAHRSTSRAARRLFGLVVVTTLAGVVATAQVRGPAEPYLFLWRQLLTTFLVAAVVWLAARTVLDRRVDLRRGLVLVAAGLLIAESAVWLRDVSRLERGRVMPFEPIARDVLSQLEDDGLPSRPVFFRGAGRGGLTEGLMDELDRRGLPVRIDDDLEFKWGTRRVARDADVSSIWYVVEDGVFTSLITAIPGSRRLAGVTPLGDDEERNLVRDQRRLWQALPERDRRKYVQALDSSFAAFVFEDVRGVDEALLDRIARSNKKVERSGTCRCAVIAFEPGPGADSAARFWRRYVGFSV